MSRRERYQSILMKMTDVMDLLDQDAVKHSDEKSRYFYLDMQDLMMTMRTQILSEEEK